MTHYEILGVPEYASNAEIKQAYRKLAAEYHPDNFSGIADPFKDIQKAWEVLRDDDSKAQYDLELNLSRKRREEQKLRMALTEMPEKKHSLNSSLLAAVVLFLIVALGTFALLSIGQTSTDSPSSPPSGITSAALTSSPATPLVSAAPTSTPAPAPSWHLVTIVSGADGTSNSDLFQIKGNKWRIDYSTGGNGLGTMYIEPGYETISLSSNSSNTYHVQRGAGNYNLKTDSYGLTFNAKVYDYY